MPLHRDDDDKQRKRRRGAPHNRRRPVVLTCCVTLAVGAFCWWAFVDDAGAGLVVDPVGALNSGAALLGAGGGGPKKTVFPRKLRGSATWTTLDRWAEAMLSTVDAHVEAISKVVHTVNGRVAVIVDGAVAERERRRVADRFIKLTGQYAQQGWHREKASDLSLEHNAMAKDMPYDECDGEALSAVRTLAPHFYDECDASKPMWVTRCSIYMQTFVDVDEAHQDRSHDDIAFSVTAIWYPHERWHAHWGGETVFLSDGGSADADLLLPVLPKPRRLLMFDSEIPHMAKPCSPISEPFRPSVTSHVTRASTRTSGNRFSFVLRTMCGRKTVEELVVANDKNGDGKLSRAEANAMFRSLDIDRTDGAIQKLAAIAAGASQFTADHLKTFFDIRYAADAPRAVALDNATLGGR